jgi:RHS repeat-associated protein
LATSAFYAFDERGNVANVLNQWGGHEDDSAFNAWGGRFWGRSDSTAFGGQWGYYTDSETGLILCTQRYYDPAAQRWVTRDPIGYAGGINLYGYVRNNPTNLYDEEGAAPKTYQTYTRTHQGSGQVYGGKASGTGTPEENVEKRHRGGRRTGPLVRQDIHVILDKAGFDPPVVDKSSPNEAAIRGREQQLCDKFGGARSEGGTSANPTRPIGPRNPNGPRYLRAATRLFGPLSFAPMIIDILRGRDPAEPYWEQVDAWKAQMMMDYYRENNIPAFIHRGTLYQSDQFAHEEKAKPRKGRLGPAKRGLVRLVPKAKQWKRARSAASVPRRGSSLPSL